MFIFDFVYVILHFNPLGFAQDKFLTFNFLVLSSIHLPEISRRKTYNILECSGKIALVVVAGLETHFRAAFIGRYQQFLGIFYSCIC